MLNWPLVIEPADLIACIDHPDLILVDLSKEERYKAGHIRGAHHVPSTKIQSDQPPAVGLLPRIEDLHELFVRLGHNEAAVYVVYDDEGGGWAGRFIWLLDVISHRRYHFLNGGIHSWLGDGYQTTREIPVTASKGIVKLDLCDKPIATLDYVCGCLANPDMVICDARSFDEFKGRKVLCKRGGHIPGAIHFEWTAGMDKDRNFRIREDIADVLLSIGIKPDKEVIVYCHTHHRSGFTYVVCKSLGYPNVKAYAGSWTEWGNHPDTPVEE